MEKPDHRHRRLLRARLERPGGGSSADKRDEFPSLQLIKLHLVPAARAGLQDIELGRISQDVTERFCLAYD